VIARPLLAGLISLALAGCAATGEAEESESPALDGAAAARSVVLCRTTVAEISALLGKPSRDGLIHGQRVLSWVTEWDPLVRYLAVLVDPQEVVVDLYWDVPSEITWMPTSQCATR
jgi:hypothetical protein